MTAGRRIAGAVTWEWIQAGLLAANLAWTTLCLGGYRPETMITASALIGALLVTHFLALAGDRRSGRSLQPAGYFLLPFLGYAAMNVVAVSPVPWLGWFDWLKWAQAATVFWVVLNGIRSAPVRRGLFFALVALGLVAVLLGSYQCFVRPDWLMLGRRQAEQFIGRASGPFGIPNSLAGFLLVLLPATGALVFRRGAAAGERVWWSWVTAVLAFGFLLTVSRGAWIALGLACMIWPMLIARWSWRRRAVIAAAILGAVIGVSAIAYELSPRMRERFDLLVRDSGELSRPILWRGAWQLFREHPLTGSGAGSYNVLFERHRPAGFVDEPQWAHNDYLNTLSDYGAIGLLLLLGGACVLLRRRPAITARESAPRDWLATSAVHRALGVGLLAFALQLLVDFHLKIPALAMIAATVAALALAPQNQSAGRLSESESAGLRGFWLACVALAVAVAFLVARSYRGEALRYQARQMLDVQTREPSGDWAGLAQDAERAFEKAVALAPGNAGAWADLAFARELEAMAAPARTRALAQPAENAARRALALSPVVPEFWIRLGVALDMQVRTSEARTAFETALRLAPRSSNAWYYYAYHLSLDTKEREAALRAIANCLSLDAGNHAAEALKAKLNARPTDAFIVP